MRLIRRASSNRFGENAGMTAVLRYRPALDTVIGLVAVIVASLWSVVVINATDAADTDRATVSNGVAEAPAPKVNFTYVVGNAVKLTSPFVKVAIAKCPAGQTVLGGGYWTNNAALRMVVSRPLDDTTGWAAGISNQPPFENIENAMVAAYAMCAKPGAPVVLPER